MNHRWNVAAFLECGAAALFLICLFRCLVVESAHLLPVCAVFLPLLAAGGVALVLLRPREDDQPEDGPEAEEDRPDSSGPQGAGGGAV